MTLWTILLLFASGLIAGIINAIAGGGLLLVYPALLLSGLSPISANITGGFGTTLGMFTSAVAYRSSIRKLAPKYYLMLILCLIGGLIGAILITHTPSLLFTRLVPWLFIVSVALIGLQPRIHRWIVRSDVGRRHPAIFLASLSLILLLAAIYGGYFGAGFGIIMLAVLGLTRLSDITQMNGIKMLAGICINLTSLAYFVFATKLVVWVAVPPLLIGNLIGGWIGAKFETFLPQRTVRALIIVIGIVIAAILLVKQ